jgi:outer membrane immunogenic protein
MNVQHRTVVTALAIAAASALIAQPAAAQTFHVDLHGGLDHFKGEGVKSNGVTYGVAAGVDFRLAPALTAGIEANADLSNNKECERGVIVASDQACLKVKNDLSAVTRIGLDLAPSTQVYALAGYTRAAFRLAYKPATGPLVNESGHADGLRVGAGIRQKLGGAVSSKLEYRYSNYEAGTERHQLIAGLGLAF